MGKHEDIQHSVLVVSSSEKFDEALKKAIPMNRVMALDFKRSSSSARRALLERYIDIVIINMPLLDESGFDLAMDITEKSNASVLVLAQAKEYEEVNENLTDLGVLVVSKPLPVSHIKQSIKFLMAGQQKFHKVEVKLERAKEKYEELRIVSRAKILLVQNKSMSEDEAHHYIEKQAMDNGASKKRIAENIIDDYE